MRYAIVSDLHANLEALERVLDDARRCQVERVVCLGDIVGYGPQARATLERIRAVSSLTLLGNHDAAVCGRISTDEFIDLAADAVSRHRAELSDEARAWLNDLPLVGQLPQVLLSHGDFTDPASFNYVDAEEIAADSFSVTSEPLLFVGHTHTPEIYVMGEAGEVARLPPQDFQLVPGERYLVNVGSVGYPRERDGRCLSSYVIYDDAEGAVLFRFLPFSVASVMQRGPRSRLSGRRGLFLGLGALAVGVLLVALGVVFSAARRPAPTQLVTQPPESARASGSHWSVLTNRTISLGSGVRMLHANVEVRGAPVILKITYRNAADEVLPKGEMLTIKKWRRKPFKVPAGATVATLELFKVDPTDRPNLISFDPVVRWDVPKGRCR